MAVCLAPSLHWFFSSCFSPPWERHASWTHFWQGLFLASTIGCASAVPVCFYASPNVVRKLFVSLAQNMLFVGTATAHVRVLAMLRGFHLPEQFSSFLLGNEAKVQSYQLR